MRTYKVVASPIRGQTITKTVTGVRELHDYLDECREQGMDIKKVSPTRRHVVQYASELQLA